MSYCFNPLCEQPQNPDLSTYCQSCGTLLCLKNRYRALKSIGQGGFGRTFLAVDEAEPLKPRCVIKQFFPQQTQHREKASELFQQEALQLKELGKHAQIPSLLDYFEQDEQQYLIQEFIDGRNLDQELAQAGTLSEAEIRELLQSLLPVIQFIHDHQVIHRDIKPANIIRRQSDRCLFLVDLGAAKQATGTALARTGTVIGSAEFAAPEQARGKAIFASDLYSLGVTCVYLLTGVSPFNLFDGSEDRWVWRDYVKRPVSSSLGRILDRLLQNATSRRYQSTSEVLGDLNPRPPIKLNTSSTAASSTVENLPQGVQTNAAETELLSKQPVKLPAINYEAGGKITNKRGGDSDIITFLIKLSSTPVLSVRRGVLILIIILNIIYSVINRPNFPSSPRALPPPNRQSKPIEQPLTPTAHPSLKPKFSNPVQPVRTFSAGIVTSLAFSPDGKRLVSGQDDSKVSLPTDRNFGQELVLKKQQDSKLQIWDFDKGSLLTTIFNDYPVNSVAVSPDGKTIASSSRNISFRYGEQIDSKELLSAVRLWSSLDGSPIPLPNLQSPGEFHSSSAFSPDGKFLASASRQGITLWNLSNGETRQIFNPTPTVFVFNPNNHQTLVTSIFNGGDETLTLWNWRNGSRISILNLQSTSDPMCGYGSLAISQDGQTLVTTSGSMTFNRPCTLEIWNLRTKKRIHSLGQIGGTRSVAISPDSKLIVSIETIPLSSEQYEKVPKGKFNLWDLQTGELLRSLSLPSPILGVVFSPDGKYLVTGGFSKTITKSNSETAGATNEENAINVWQVDQLTSGNKDN